MSGDGSGRSWWQALRWDPLPRLLDPQHPNLMWRTLVEVVGRPPQSPAVRRARGGANARPPVSDLLAGLDGSGQWRDGAGLWPHFSGLAWRLVAAAQLGADPTDPRLAVAGALLEVARAGALAPEGASLPCATARGLAALAAFGHATDLRFSEGLAWLADQPPAGDGGWACDRHGRDRGCAVTAVALLEASDVAAEVEGRGLAVRAAESLLTGGLDALSGRLGWPNLLRADLGEGLAALARAGRRYDRRLDAGLRRLQGLQDERGMWHATVKAPRSLLLATPFDADAWVTLHAVAAVARYGEEAGLPRMYPEKPS